MSKKHCAKLLVLSALTITCACICFTCSAGQTIPMKTFTGHAAIAFGASVPNGYLFEDKNPLDGLFFLPSPPLDGSAAQALDDEKSKESLVLKDTPRWTLASQDAILTFPQVAESFSCALGIRITEKETPHLYLLMRRVMIDAIWGTNPVKFKYKRGRPFVKNKKPICSPNDKELLRENPSYPSGHASYGWAIALILSEIDNVHANQILARGRSFGDSRVVCNVHWQSDVQEGRLLGAAVVTRLHTNADFHEDLVAAKKEVAVARTKRLLPTRDCKKEADALALKPYK